MVQGKFSKGKAEQFEIYQDIPHPETSRQILASIDGNAKLSSKKVDSTRRAPKASTTGKSAAKETRKPGSPMDMLQEAAEKLLGSDAAQQGFPEGPEDADTTRTAAAPQNVEATDADQGRTTNRGTVR
jgi:hypothetical protein